MGQFILLEPATIGLKCQWKGDRARASGILDTQRPFQRVPEHPDNPRCITGTTQINGGGQETVCWHFYHFLNLFENDVINPPWCHIRPSVAWLKF